MNLKVSKRPIILMAGGTGGHVIPAQILKKAFEDKGTQIFFVTDQRGEVYFNDNVPFEGLVLKMESGTFLRRLFGVLKNVGKLLKLFLKIKPQGVIGFGGYPSAAGGIAAALLRLPLFIHEQNAVLGRVNRLFVYYAKILFLTFPATQKVPFSQRKKEIYAGPLVRPEIEMLGVNAPYLEWDKKSKFCFLIIGGSQGSSPLVKIVLAALAQVPPALRKKLFIILQVPSSLSDETKIILKDLGIIHDVAPFFQNMSDHLKKAHLVMARAGSGTVGEILASRRPCIFVPLPNAMDDHQTVNASYLEKIGGGWSFPQRELSAEMLSDLLQKFLETPETLTHVSHVLDQQYNLGAAHGIVGVVDESIKSLHKES